MVTTRRDPYLWLHLCGLATVPLWLDGCLTGLAVGDPIAPSSVEIALLAIIGIVPVLVMQWRQPFYLFSLLVVTLQPKALTVPQRQLLRLQRHWLHRAVALAIAALLGWALVVIYQVAPIASEVTPLTRWGHAGGWCVAAGCFWGANLFLQGSLSALRLLLARPRAVAALEPYDVETVLRDFTVVGLRLGQILPPSLMPTPAVAPPRAGVDEPSATLDLSDPSGVSDLKANHPGQSAAVSAPLAEFPTTVHGGHADSLDHPLSPAASALKVMEVDPDISWGVVEADIPLAPDPGPPPGAHPEVQQVVSLLEVVALVTPTPAPIPAPTPLEIAIAAEPGDAPMATPAESASPPTAAPPPDPVGEVVPTAIPTGERDPQGAEPAP